MTLHTGTPDGLAFAEKIMNAIGLDTHTHHVYSIDIHIPANGAIEVIVGFNPRKLLHSIGWDELSEAYIHEPEE